MARGWQRWWVRDREHAAVEQSLWHAGEERGPREQGHAAHAHRSQGIGEQGSGGWKVVQRDLVKGGSQSETWFHRR